MLTNHIQTSPPAGMRPPPHLLRRLRRIDPTLDCQYVGQGRWIVGSVQPNRHRRRIGGRMLEEEKKDSQEQKLAYARLAMHGFRPIAAFQRPDGDWGRIVSDIRERDFRHRRDRDGEFNAKMRASSLEGPSDEVLMQQVEDRIHQEWRFLFKDPTSVHF